MLRSQRKKFSLPASAVYLNCAYMSPLLKKVELAGVKGMQRKRNPIGISAADFFADTEYLRKEYGKLINVRDHSRIVVIPSVSYGMANVVNNIAITSQQHVIVTGEQFPSNYYPWHKLCSANGALLKTVSAPPVGEGRGKEWNTRILEAINNDTRVVAIGQVHWTDGTLFDLVEIRKRTREVGALLIIDGTQSVGALPFDVRKVKPDALICAGYKWLLGPYTVGLAYFGEYFDGGKPIEESWLNRLHSENFSALVNYQEAYQPGALRYEMGEHSNFIEIPMMLEALRQINEWRPERIQDYCRRISEKAILRLREGGFWIEDENFRGCHLFGMRLPAGRQADDIKNRIAKAKIGVSFRGDSVRIAPHLYNTEGEMDKLVRVLLR